MPIGSESRGAETVYRIHERPDHHNMLDGRAKLTPIDNARYPGINWTTARDVLITHLSPM